MAKQLPPDSPPGPETALTPSASAAAESPEEQRARVLRDALNARQCRQSAETSAPDAGAGSAVSDQESIVVIVNDVITNHSYSRFPVVHRGRRVRQLEGGMALVEAFHDDTDDEGKPRVLEIPELVRTIPAEKPLNRSQRSAYQHIPIPHGDGTGTLPCWAYPDEVDEAAVMATRRRWDHRDTAHCPKCGQPTPANMDSVRTGPVDREKRYPACPACIERALEQVRPDTAAVKSAV